MNDLTTDELAQLSASLVELLAVRAEATAVPVARSTEAGVDEGQRLQSASAAGSAGWKGKTRATVVSGSA